MAGQAGPGWRQQCRQEGQGRDSNAGRRRTGVGMAVQAGGRPGWSGQAGGGWGWRWQGRQEEDWDGDGSAGRRKSRMGMAVQAGGGPGWRQKCRQEEDQGGDQGRQEEDRGGNGSAGRRRSRVGMAMQAGGGPATTPQGCLVGLVIPGPAQTMPSTGETAGEMPEVCCVFSLPLPLQAGALQPSQLPWPPRAASAAACSRYSLRKEQYFITHQSPLAAAPSQQVMWVPDTPPCAFTAARSQCCLHVFGLNHLPAGRSLPGGSGQAGFPWCRGGHCFPASALTLLSVSQLLFSSALAGLIHCGLHRRS